MHLINFNFFRMELDEARLYQTFLNAFSYTLAVSTVGDLVRSGGHDLLVLAAAVALMVVFLGKMAQEIKGGLDLLQKSPGQTHLYQLVAGPARMVLFLITTASSVLVQFLSTALGRWAIELAGHTTTTLIPTVMIGTALLWLLGVSVGMMQG